MRSLATWLLVLVLSLGTSSALAQESGGSFGGSSWDDPPSGGGGGGGSDWGGGGGGSGWDDDHAAREAEARADEARRAAEARADEARRAEEARIEAERRAEEARRAEAERLRLEAIRRARLMALSPADRAAELLPAPPTAPTLSGEALAVSVPMPRSRDRWSPPVSPPAIAANTAYVRPFDPGMATCCVAVFGLLFLPITFFATRKPRPPEPDVPWTPRAPAGPAGQARKVSLAFDWTSRAALQTELRAMSQRLDMKSRPGLHAAAQQVAALLTRHGRAARYATWELSGGDARGWFQSRVNDLRSRFQTDRVRNAGGQQVGAGMGAHVARPEEGQGLVVVSVLVASKSPMRIAPVLERAEDVAAVLAALAPGTPNEMLALEVIWSPSEENDRMSSLELERFYPELMPLGSGVGRYQCTFCRAPYPRELGKCPTCGGPAKG